MWAIYMLNWCNLFAVAYISYVEIHKFETAELFVLSHSVSVALFADLLRQRRSAKWRGFQAGPKKPFKQFVRKNICHLRKSKREVHIHTYPRNMPKNTQIFGIALGKFGECQAVQGSGQVPRGT